LEHRFTVSVTAHSISILSELKMTSYGPYTGVLSISCAINCTRLKPMPNVHSSTSWTRDWYTRCWTRQ